MNKILEIGPGTPTGESVIFPGADTVDVYGANPTARVEWGVEPLPFEANTYDLVFVSHVLDYIPWYRAVVALREALRVLKPGGELEIYVTDFSYITQMYHEKRPGDSYRMFNDAGGWMTWINGRLFGTGPDVKEFGITDNPWPHQPKRSAYDLNYLESRLADAGFQDIRSVPGRRNGNRATFREIGAIGNKSHA